MTKLIQTKCSKGSFIHFDGDLYIPESLQKYGGWENEIYEACKEYIKPNSTVIEVGAHIGTHTIPFAKLCPEGQLIAFEMQRFIFQILNTNIILNGCKNVVTYQEMVSNVNAETFTNELDYWSKDNFNSGNTHLQTLETNKGIPIKKTTLDQKFFNLEKIDLIKIDVECHELQVLQGALQLIRRCKPIIVTEYHTVTTKYDNGNQKEIINLLPDYTFKEVVGICKLNNRTIANYNMIGVPK
jgi:FkbM family methyltransferase